MTFLMAVVGLIVTLGVLVTLHELGHYFVARKSGVKVERFSVGFGKAIWSYTAADGVEWCVARIPLGGYVKMDEDSFRAAPASHKIAISLAGPAANFAFAVLAYALMFVVGIPGMKPVIGEVERGSVMADAGIEAGDRFVRIDGEPTPTWEAALLALLEAVIDDEAFTVEVADRNEVTREATLYAGEPRALTEPGALLPGVGITPWRPKLDAVLATIEDGSPAQAAGLQAGDRIVAIDGEPVSDWLPLVERIRASPYSTVDLTVERDGDTQVITTEVWDTDGNGVGRIGAGVDIPEGLYDGMLAELRYGPVAAVGHGATKTYEMSVLTLKMLGRMLTGDVSVKNISGPINIAQYAGATASAGVLAFLSFLAIVSISLGIINLLPIPILDGGHLVYHLAELVTGRPVSEAVEAIGQRIGLGMLAALMGLAFYNDLARILG